MVMQEGGAGSFLGRDPSKEIHPGLMLVGQNAAAWEREIRVWDFWSLVGVW